MPDVKPEIEIKGTIASFLSKPVFNRYFRYTRIKQETVARLLDIFIDTYNSKLLEKEILTDTIPKTVISYTHNKSTAMGVFKSYLEFLKKEYNFDAEIIFPPIDSSNSFERQMYIAKTLQNSDKTVEDLSKELWVHERTIEDDLLRLRGKTNDPIQICSIPFIIRESQRKNGRFSFASTAHPFFLTYNLTQVICTLKGLKLMCDEPAMKKYALLSARSIWQQLSDYAKDRIIYVLTNLLPDEVNWYKCLETLNEEMFYTEYECGSSSGPGIIMDCIKNGKACFIEYCEEDNAIFLNNCRIIRGSYTGESVKVSCDQGEFTLLLDKVLRSAYSVDILI